MEVIVREQARVTPVCKVGQRTETDTGREGQVVARWHHPKNLSGARKTYPFFQDSQLRAPCVLIPFFFVFFSLLSFRLHASLAPSLLYPMVGESSSCCVGDPPQEPQQLPPPTRHGNINRG